MISHYWGAIPTTQQNNKEMITIKNYFNSTYGLFRACKIPKRKPNYISYAKNRKVWLIYVYELLGEKQFREIEDTYQYSLNYYTIVNELATSFGFLNYKDWRNSHLSDIEGNESSYYWYGSNSNGEYIIRQSNHWSNAQCGKIASCCWELKNLKENHIDCGKIYVKNFRKIN